MASNWEESECFLCDGRNTKPVKSLWGVTSLTDSQLSLLLCSQHGQSGEAGAGTGSSLRFFPTPALLWVCEAQTQAGLAAAAEGMNASITTKKTLGAAYFGAEICKRFSGKSCYWNKTNKKTTQSVRSEKHRYPASGQDWEAGCPSLLLSCCQAAELCCGKYGTTEDLPGPTAPEASYPFAPGSPTLHCPGMPSTAQGCLALPRYVWHCPGMSSTAQGCPALLRDAQRCPGMPSTAQGLRLALGSMGTLHLAPLEGQTPLPTAPQHVSS